HPEAHVIEVVESDLDHALLIKGYDVGDDTEIKEFSVDEKAFFIVDENETQIAPFDRQFASKSVGQRAMQLFAGPMMNFILAILVFIIIGLFQGVPSDKALIGEVQPDSPAAEAGMQEGDEVIQVEGSSVTTWPEFTKVVEKSPNEAIDIKVLREG